MLFIFPFRDAKVQPFLELPKFKPLKNVKIHKKVLID